MREESIHDDPSFDAEVEALLRPGNPDLLRGIRPETLAAMGLGQAPRKERRYFWYGTAAAAAVAATLALFVADGARLIAAPAPSGGFETKFSGYIESSRGAPAEPEVPTYSAESILELELSQTETKPREPAEELALFEVDVERKLRRLSMETEHHARLGRPISFRAQARIHVLFGPKPSGKKVLALVVGRYSSDLDALDGADLSDVESRADLRLFSRAIVIVPSLSRSN